MAEVDMPLTTGARLGPYEIVGLLGRGGMGEVYRARDPRLNRDVAIKILARAGTDPVRQRRFTEEAQAASALNHPNIVTVHDVGTHEGIPYIVSELVDGTSLRGVLARAPLPVREALDLAWQMADGLAAAHQAGIVHRDFKPENVMVTRDGRVKILDFGLSLVGPHDGVSASEVDVTLTAAGVITGTVPYMSPEQARGAAIDYRSDQFSFGLTLYELVTGQRAFKADTAAQVIAAILRDEPEPIEKLNPRIPAPVRWVIERCLAKDPRQRYESTTDLARELRTLRDRLGEVVPVVPEATPVVPSRRVRAVTLTVLSAALAGAAALLVWNVGANNAPDLSAYRMTPIATDSGYESSPAWSPDGKTLAYVAEVDGVLQVFTRAFGSSMRTQVTRGRFDCREPFWSPDGTRLYYIALARDRDGLWSISAAGGEAELVMENVSSAALSPDGRTLAFFPAGGDRKFRTQLYFSSPPGSAPVRYTRPPFGARPGYGAGHTLHFSPDGSKLGVWVEQLIGEGQHYGPEFWVLPLGEATPYLAPTPAPDLPNFAAPFSWLPDGRRVVSALPHPRPGMHLWLTDTERVASRLLTMTGVIENDPAVSPDGRKIAFALQRADYDLLQFAVDGSPPSIAAATSRGEMDLSWSAAGDSIAFTTDRTGHNEIWLRTQKGDSQRPLVTPLDFGESRTFYLNGPAFSPDGQRIAYSRLGADGNRIWISPVAGGPPVRLTAELYGQEWPSWSPDGSWIVFGGSDRGLPLSEARWSLRKIRVGSRTPAETLTRDILPQSPVRWAPDGAWVAFNSASGLAIISPDGQAKRVVHELAWFAFDWSADSRRLYGIRQSDDFNHMTFTSVEIASGVEHVLSANFRPLPAWGQLVRGFTRVAPKTFLTSIADVRSDVWMLEGFDVVPGAWDRVVGSLRQLRTRQLRN